MVTVNKLEWNKRGHRRRPGCGLKIKSACGRYALFKSDRIDGIALPLLWLAIYRVGGEEIIGRHRTRRAAEKTCERHARQRGK